MKPICYYFLLLLIIPCTGFSQENAKRDSLLQLYNAQPDDTVKVNYLEDLFWATHHIDPEEAKAYSEKAIALSRKINFPKGEGRAHYKIGAGYYWEVGNTDSMRYHLNKAVSLSEKVGDERLLIIAKNWLGVSEYRDGNYLKAIAMYDEGITFAEAHGNYKDAAIAYGYKVSSYEAMGAYKLALQNAITSLKLLDSLAKISMDKDMYLRLGSANVQAAQAERSLGNYKQSLAYAKEAVRHFEAGEYRTSVAEAYSDVGTAYENLNDLENAEHFLKKGLAIAEETNLNYKIGFIKTNLSDVYFQQGKYTKAINTLEEALKIQEEFGSERNLSTALQKLGKVHIKIGKPKQALRYLDRAIQLWDSTEISDVLKYNYMFRADAHKELGDYKKANADLEMYQKLNDSIFNKTKSQQIEEMRIIFDTEKKEQQIALQQNEIALLDQKAKVGNLQKLLLAIGLLLSVLGFYAVRQKLQRSRAERQVLDSELAFKKKELTTHALHLAKKNEVLENLKQKAKELKTSEQSAGGYQQLIQTITFDQQDDKNWESFTQYFEQVHKDFAGNVKAKYPEVTKNELRFMALMKMNMSSKEIASILNISTAGVKKARNRLRKKLEMTPEESLEDLIIAI
ncbi:tetratricopeptide repeat protein [Flagellimonas flava]|uniref:tetratricopeptide repeat protein n=1 Tax=Flagellimonas flava TaxID=570519 RepID=UPI003D64FDED